MNKMFSNVCKHHLIVYGCLKFTFIKVGRTKKNRNKKKELKKMEKEIRLSQTFRSPLLPLNNECSVC